VDFAVIDQLSRVTPRVSWHFPRDKRTARRSALTHIYAGYVRRLDPSVKITPETRATGGTSLF
jgi:hypothetical protein